MKKFLVIYYSPRSEMAQMEGASEEDIKKGMEPWMQWADRSGDHLVDMGTPQTITNSGSSASARNVVGCSIQQANDMKSAKNLLEGHPHLNVKGA